METSMPSPFFFSWHVSGLDLSLYYHQDLENDDFLVWLSSGSDTLTHLEPNGMNQRQFRRKNLRYRYLSESGIARPQVHCSLLLPALA
jgi:hypothetical protein